MFLLPFVPGCQLENANYLAESTKAFLVFLSLGEEEGKCVSACMHACVCVYMHVCTHTHNEEVWLEGE